MFERRHQALLPRPLFIRRLRRYTLAALLLVSGAWLVGILGYRAFENMAWSDAILNSAMLLGGMGPVSPLHTTAGKLFASFYALFAGIIFLVAVGVLVAPILHRLLHQFHVEADQTDPPADDS